jgi:hypothetical protein
MGSSTAIRIVVVSLPDETFAAENWPDARPNLLEFHS